jgi:uncharacterized protein YeaO (DUF488 family)
MFHSSCFTHRRSLIAVPIKTKRWNDPIDPDDGHRLLITRYRPRALPKSEETWNAWDKDLGPSADLHAAVYGKRGHQPLAWDTYRQRYLKEMLHQKAKIKALAARVKTGETLTLLCSNQCTRENRCHRSILKSLIQRQLEIPEP